VQTQRDGALSCTLANSRSTRKKRPGYGRFFLRGGHGGREPRAARNYGVEVISEAEIANPTITNTITRTNNDVAVTVRRMSGSSVRWLGRLERVEAPGFAYRPRDQLALSWRPVASGCIFHRRVRTSS
jgi:hypothetical protein